MKDDDFNDDVWWIVGGIALTLLAALYAWILMR